MEFEKLTNQARFVKMIVERQLSVSGRKKADIVQDLIKHEFQRFSKGKAKAAGETEKTVEDEDENEDEAVSGATTDFDYLLGMPIWNLTKEKVRCMVFFSLTCSHSFRSRNLKAKLRPRSKSCLRSSRERLRRCGILISTNSFSNGRYEYANLN
jgi:hypothetical protein